MMIRYLTCVVVVLLATLPVAAQPADEPDSQDDSLITIKGQSYELFPPDQLQAHGFEVPNIPPEDNAAFVYIEAMNVHVTQPPWDTAWREAYEGALEGKWPEGEQGDRLAVWLEENQPCFDLVERASQMDQYYLPLFKGENDLFIAAVLPTLAPTREIAKNLVVKSTYLASQGRADEAMDVLLTVQRMGHHVGNGNTVIEGLVGITVDAISTKGVTRLAESGQVSAEKLKEVSEMMEVQSDNAFKFDRMLQLERVCATSYVDDAIDVIGFSSFFDPEQIPTATATTPWTTLAKRIKRIYLPDRTMKEHIKSHYDALEEATRREDGIPSGTIDEAELFNRVPQWDVISRMMLPSLSRAYDLTLRSESNSVRARLTTAVTAYKQEHGEYPPTLNALQPEYVSRVPIDPMTGYEFDYKVEGNKPSGLEPITKEVEQKLIEKRRQPAILNPRASRWRRYVEDFCTRFDLTQQQRAAADAILRNMEAQAHAFERAHGAKLQQLIDAGETDRAKEKTEPLDRLYEQLKKRLQAIPTAAQRAAAADAKADISAMNRNQKESGR